MARLSYVGPVNKHDFKNFELKIEVLAKPGSNGGVFFHTGPHPDYHKPTDTVEKINYKLMAKRAQLVFYAAWEMANREAMMKRDIALPKME